MRSNFIAVTASVGRCATDKPRDGGLEAEVLALFDQLRDPLLRYLSTFGLPVPDGEEIIQEAFLALVRHLQAGKSRENLPGWLFRVAHNLALKARHRDRRNFENRASSGGAGFIIDAAPNPEERAADTQNRRHLRAVVEALPQRDRQCLFLRAEGLRYRGIADVLNISVGAVSLSLSRSLARLASVIERCKL
jgi:RNA polymerase sigma-70 factor (ECF subfamily)